MSENENKQIKLIPIIGERKTINLEEKKEIETVRNKSKFQFQCIICERFFTLKTVVENHLRRIHKIENEAKSLEYYIHCKEILKENLNAVDPMRFNVTRNLKTYSRPIIKQEIKIEPEMILPD